MADQDPFAGTEPLVKAPYDPTQAQETIRGTITIVATGLFTLILAL